jgi:hypothetical protein
MLDHEASPTAPDVGLTYFAETTYFRLPSHAQVTKMTHYGGVTARLRTGRSPARSYIAGFKASLRQTKEGFMTSGRFFGKTGRGLAIAAAILAAIGLTTVPRPADAGGGWGGGGGGISPGAAVGLGLGAFALGSVLANPYYSNPYYYPYGYYPPTPAYYPPAGYYPPARSCWNPYYRYYYAC